MSQEKLERYYDLSGHVQSRFRCDTCNGRVYPNGRMSGEAGLVRVPHFQGSWYFPVAPCTCVLGAVVRAKMARAMNAAPAAWFDEWPVALTELTCDERHALLSKIVTGETLMSAAQKIPAERRDRSKVDREKILRVVSGYLAEAGEEIEF